MFLVYVGRHLDSLISVAGECKIRHRQDWVLGLTSCLTTNALRHWEKGFGHCSAWGVCLNYQLYLRRTPSASLLSLLCSCSLSFKMWKREGREGVVIKSSYQGVVGEGESLALLPGMNYTFYTLYHHHHRKHHWEIVLFSSCRVPESHLFPICCRSYWGGCLRQAGLPSGLRCLWWGSIWS